MLGSVSLWMFLYFLFLYSYVSCCRHERAGYFTHHQSGCINAGRVASAFVRLRGIPYFGRAIVSLAADGRGGGAIGAINVSSEK